MKREVMHGKKCPYCKHEETNETEEAGLWYCNDCGEMFYYKTDYNKRR
jgi:ribosomal protein L37AE/L43A